MLSDLRRSLPDGCLSDLVLDELLAGELSGPSAGRAEQHVRECERCRERRRALVADRQDFLLRYPLAPRTHASRARRRAYTALLTGLALAAGAALWVARPEPDAAIRLSEARPKGAPHLGFHVKRSDRIFQGGNGEHVEPGDRLRFTVYNAPSRHVAVLSRDGRGAATVYYPAQSRSRELGPASEAPLDAAVELDAVRGGETLFGVFCDAPFEIEPLRAALERDGHLPTMTGCSIDELRLVKDPD